MERKVILVIDDDMDFASIVEIKLEGKGFDVRAAHMPDEGMRMIRELRPALVLLDINMPTANGVEFLAEMKKIEDVRNIPVAFFSNLTNPWTSSLDVGEAAKELGAKAFIDKAIDLDRLVERVKELVGEREAEEKKI